MSLKDKSNLQQETHSTGGNKRNWKGLLYLILGTMIFTTVGASALTVVVLQKFGLIASNSSTPSSSPSITAQSPVSSPSPIASPTTSPVEVATPVVTPSQSSTISSETQSSLINIDCQSATPGLEIGRVLRKVDKSASIGGEVLSLVVNMGKYYDENIEGGQPFEAVCNVNNNFTELKLVYGVDSSNRYAISDNKLLFKVELDNKPGGIQEVVVGKKYTANLNLQGVKNVKLRAECINKECPSLSFAEMSLR